MLRRGKVRQRPWSGCVPGLTPCSTWISPAGSTPKTAQDSKAPVLHRESAVSLKRLTYRRNDGMVHYQGTKFHRGSDRSSAVASGRFARALSLATRATLRARPRRPPPSGGAGRLRALRRSPTRVSAPWKRVRKTRDSQLAQSTAQPRVQGFHRLPRDNRPVINDALYSVTRSDPWKPTGALIRSPGGGNGFPVSSPRSRR